MKIKWTSWFFSCTMNRWKFSNYVVIELSTPLDQQAKGIRFNQSSVYWEFRTWMVSWTISIIKLWSGERTFWRSYERIPSIVYMTPFYLCSDTYIYICMYVCKRTYDQLSLYMQKTKLEAMIHRERPAAKQHTQYPKCK